MSEARRADMPSDQDETRAFEAALAADPDDLPALFGLGVAELRRRDFDAALPRLARAAKLAPDDHPAVAAYVQGLIATAQFRPALNVLEARPGAAQAAALRLRLHQAWGFWLVQDGQLAAAVTHFRAAVHLAPRDPDAHADLGLAELRQEHLPEAIAAFQQALAIAPDHLGALVNLGAALRLEGRLEAAADCYRRALAVQPDLAAAQHNLAAVQRQLAAPDAEAAAPPSAALLIARGDAFAGRGKYDEALGCYAAAAEDPAARHRALVQAAAVQQLRGRHGEALAALDQAIALEPDAPLAHLRRAFERLLAGDYAGGWADYEYRLPCEEEFPSGRAMTWAARRALTPDAPRAALEGRRVLLLAEQGVGDEVMFASCIPDLASVAASVTCVCEARLVGLFAHSFPQVRFLSSAETEVTNDLMSEFETVFPMGSLGRLFRARREDFPGRPYLSPRREVVERWTARLGPRAGRLRIGVSWRGGVKGAQPLRSMRLDQMAPILDLPGCEVVSLQYGDVADEVAAANRGRTMPIRLFPAAEIDDFEELAGLVRALDAVVSVQNSLVHLCGAVGADCRALIPSNPEWRYLLEGAAMPWYGSVRLHRQAAPGDWGPPLDEVRAALASRGQGD